MRSGFMPPLLLMKPKNSSAALLKSHFFALSVMLLSDNFLRSLSRVSFCFCSTLQKTIMSSEMLIARGCQLVALRLYVEILQLLS